MQVAILQSPNSQQFLELNHYREDIPYATQYIVGEGLDHLGFKVDNVKAAYENLQSKGAEAAPEPTNETDGRLAFLLDTDGIWIELFQYSEEMS